jgi:NAD(P)-dependent dehydrogenase (short-subunit alcohol dehydrogenase family)
LLGAPGLSHASFLRCGRHIVRWKTDLYLSRSLNQRFATPSIAMATLALASCLTANAQSVALSGVLGSKALLVIDGGAPRALAAGDSAQEQAWMREAVQQVTESTFFKRYGSIDEQVGPILFLASDEAAYITGSVLPVAGGDLG